MTKKHKLRKSKHILENKKDVDDNVENILRMIGEDNESAENEPSDDSGNAFKKSKLSSLVKGFHEEYEYLHKHYKQLIGKLENVGHSSSDSDSSDSDDEEDGSHNDAVSEENGWKQKLVEDPQGKEQSLEVEIQKLKKNTEEQAKEISDLKELLDRAIKDKEATRLELSSDFANLSSENENLKLLVDTAERETGESHKTIALMENEIRTLSVEKQVVEKERDGLKISVVDLENKRVDLSNQLQDTMEKCTFLSSQLEKAQLTEKEVQTLLSEIEMMKNEKLMLSRENDNLKVCEKNLDTECSQLKATIAETKAENNTLTEEKHLLESKLQLLGVNINGLIAEKEELMNNMNIERGAAGEEKERLVSEHSKCLHELDKAQSSLKELESTNGALNDEIAAIQEEKIALASKLQQLEASFKNLGNELEQELERISVMQKNNEDLESVNSNLQNELATVQGQKDVAVASTVELGNKLEEQNQQIINLQEAIENLEAAKSNMYNEVTVLQEEKNAALLQVQELDACLKNLESELEQKQNQVLALQKANEELLEKSSSLERQLEEARSTLQDEIIALQGEKEKVLDNLQQSNTSIKTLGEELEKQREHNSILQLASEDLHKSIANLEKELEDNKVSSHAEILELQEQKNKALSDLQQSEVSIKNLRMELEQGREEISILHLSNEDMKDNNDRLNQQLEETRTSLHADIAALRAEKDTAQIELQQSLASVRNFETVIGKQTESLSSLQQANDDLKKNNHTLTEQFEVIKIELQEEVTMAHEEKDATLTQLEKSEDSIKKLESEMVQLKEELSIQMENNSSLNKQLEEAILKVSNLNEELKTVQAETASKINEMSANTKDLVKTIDLLSSQKIKVEENMKIITEACMEKLSFMKDFEDQVKQKVTDREIAIACLQQSLRGIVGSCQSLQYAYGEVSTRASHLEVLRRNHIEQIDKLEDKYKEILEKHRHLEEDNVYANKETRKLQNHVQELEAQLQLAKQKLRVTEAESKSKEDSYVMTVQTSHREIQCLEQKIQNFCGQNSLLEQTLVQMKGNAESGISTLVDHLDELESHFNNSFSKFSARSFACTEELELLRNRLHHHLAEQKELVKENDELCTKLREKENVLSEMVRSASEANEKMAQLEKTIDDKEEELSARVQEKREAIKQLSDAIIYHKNNSDDLVRYIRNYNRPRLPFCF
ncbi:COP1-interactive protein 1-like [Oryza brachyantha]|uniref:NAB domain-containing protein n=1 Tax=Oryza brachyantha TaxID=4533 RepID=J3KUW3_ORYBR|nr:COP1-interactive protein 1-like [Oryza brachyantha]XP_015698979.1 COP1-interactive protein 1-like [Oryza brachyantha]